MSTYYIIDTTINTNLEDIFKVINKTDDIFEIKLSNYDIILNLKTDFKSYCIIEQNNEFLKDKINKFNVNIIFKDKTLENILDEINNTINYTSQNNSYIDNDNFHFYKKINNNLNYSKINIDYINIKRLLLLYNKDPSQSLGYNSVNNFTIPKDLLLNSNQIVNLIMNEIIKINQTKDYDHIINILDEKQPYTLNVTLFLKKAKCKLVEFDFIINPLLYPFYPPTIKYKQPEISSELLINITNLDILKIENWTSTVTLEYLITNIANQLELVIDNHINVNYSNKLKIHPFNKTINQLKCITNKTTNNIITILPPKKISTNNGIGYGTHNSKQWDIKSYIQSINIENSNILQCLSKIYMLMTEKQVTIEQVTESYCLEYIITELNGINLLEYNKKPVNYDYMFKILDMLNLQNHEKYDLIASNLKQFKDEIETFKLTSQIDDNIALIENICNKFNKKEDKPIDDSIYISSMKKLTFDMYKLPETHLFYKYSKDKLDKETIKRISSEIGSFKNGLPLTYDSSIWIRISKENINLMTFIISGPKDTPYENGLFEFHAYLPNGYPNVVPQVLIKTTGNGKVRFNPNLYDSGKVCLSLLNTWSGDEGEKWNPETSTFLQVMVSIQSLILIDKPYFNEPGYTKDYGTPHGETLSNDYNKKLYPHTVKVAMIDMLENPPVGFESIVKNHFKLKRDDINKTLIKWGQDKYLNDLNKLIDQI